MPPSSSRSSSSSNTLHLRHSKKPPEMSSLISIPIPGGASSLILLTLLMFWLFLFLFSCQRPPTDDSRASGVCDASVGRWEYDPRPPLYTNDTCRYIHPSQNCFKNGRPDREFLYWRWKPKNCELPDLDPPHILASLRDKRMVFIGDSLARNHMQSLLCTLTQVEEPVKIFHNNETLEIIWRFPSHNFTLADMWSPFLVGYVLQDDIYRLQLDLPESAWTSKLGRYDVAVISSGYWFFRPCLYFQNGKLLGSNMNSGGGGGDSFMRPAYRIVHQQVLKHMAEMFGGITVLRTITVDHFEQGPWDGGGYCNRTRPHLDTNTPMPWMSAQMREIQVQEFGRAAGNGINSQRLKLLDVTYSALLRPDAHPGAYKMAIDARNDCLHWCMPGAIDSWNQLLFHILLL